MKIKKNVLHIEVTCEEARNDLRNCQGDMLNWLEQEGENSEWFQNLIEKHGIHWFSTPETTGYLVELMEQFPFIFGFGFVIKENSVGDNNFDENSFEVYLNGVKLNSKTIWSNF